MEYSDTTALRKIEQMNARINIIQGGARSGKTVSVLIMLCDLSFDVKDKIIHIVSDSYPNLANGAMTDWQRLLRGTCREYYFDVNQSTHIWKNKCTNTIIKFISCDAEDALGAPRDYLFVNEANRISYDTFGQLEMRTTETIWLDYNPTSEFWAMSEIMAKRNDWGFIKLTYKDNEAIPENVLKALLQRKGDGNNNFWRVFGLGEVGSLEGNVYTGWTPSERQDGDKLIRYGLDFGFSNDETACVAVYERAGGLFIEERLYKTGLVSGQVVSAVQGVVAESGDAIIVCDSARPEIIADMKRNGLMAIPCNKGAGSVLAGVDAVSSYKIWYSGKNLEKEFLTYAWKKRKDGTVLDAPQDGQDHLLDALRYAIYDLKKPPVFDWS